MFMFSEKQHLGCILITQVPPVYTSPPSLAHREAKQISRAGKYRKVGAHSHKKKGLQRLQPCEQLCEDVLMHTHALRKILMSAF